MSEPSDLEIAGHSFAPGENRTIELAVGQSLVGSTISVPINVQRGLMPGPTLLLTGGVHGDEYNGPAVIRELITNPLPLKKGSLVMVPVVNVHAFEQRMRYMPDRRDLNRCFPGLIEGSQSSRYAAVFFQEVVLKCSCGIDLHSAASPRTNHPNLRADLSNPMCQKLSTYLGCEIIMDAKGIVGTLRREATAAGVPVVLMEAGETMRTSPNIVNYTLQRLISVIAGLGMIDAEPIRPKFRATIVKSSWVRADYGGFLEFKVASGDIVHRGQVLATHSTIMGGPLADLRAPHDGIIIGMTTSPTALPGDPICHLAIPKGGIKRILNTLDSNSLANETMPDPFDVEAITLGVY
jgi:predicted deacylase